MQGTKRLFAAALMVGAVVGTTGCTKLIAALKKKSGDAGATASAGNAPLGDDADEQLSEKLDEYIKCLNNLSTPIHQSRHRYLTYISRTGPTGREGYADLYRLPLGETANCAAGVARAKTMSPPDAKLESTGQEYSDAASEIDRLVVEADRYYENKEFKDDKWAKGKALHPRLMTSWARFSKADKDLHDTLDGVTKPLAQRVLGRIEREDGKRFRWHRKHVLISSREMVEASDPVGEDDDVDVELYSASYTTFEQALTDLETYGSTHKAELSDSKRSPNSVMGEMNYLAFVKEANDFKKAAKEFWRCLRDAPAKAKSPSGKIDMEKLGNCGGIPGWKKGDEVVKQYNEFINASNKRQFP